MKTCQVIFLYHKSFFYNRQSFYFLRLSLDLLKVINSYYDIPFALELD